MKIIKKVKHTSSSLQQTLENEREQREREGLMYRRMMKKFREDANRFWNGEGFIDDNGKFHPYENRGKWGIEE